MRDVRHSPITGRIGKSEIDKLSNTPNGDFMILHKADRVELELTLIKLRFQIKVS